MAEEKKAEAGKEKAAEKKVEPVKEAPKTEKKVEKPVKAEAKPAAKPAGKPEKKPTKPAKPVRGKKGKPPEKKVERQFVISLKKVCRVPRPKRANRAVAAVKKFMFKHFRVSAENVFISQQLNQWIWSRGREHIPKRIEVRAVESEGKVRVYLQKEKVVEKKPVEKPKEEEKKTKEDVEAEKAREEELERKKKEKREIEKSAEAAAMKKGIKE